MPCHICHAVAVALRGLDVDALIRPEVAHGADGAVLEGFVFTELIRQLAEIDVVVETVDGRVAGIKR